mmetsp:Transcript_28958/g.76408  ORF Transcript_28958/g.76408 Transcript_28958/m.76408 type:complete len:95 (-) Transcript_28958:79-363(-)
MLNNFKNKANEAAEATKRAATVQKLKYDRSQAVGKIDKAKQRWGLEAFDLYDKGRRDDVNSVHAKEKEEIRRLNIQIEEIDQQIAEVNAKTNNT